MKNIKNIFRNLEKQLRQTSWFNEDWEIYNRGDYLQLYKVNWCNQNQGGVHFETFIEAPQIKKKSFPICMHAEEDCPSRNIFKENFLRFENERLNQWKGYERVGGEYSIIQKTLPLNYKNLEKRLFDEFSQLRKLANSVDDILNSINRH